MLTILLLGAVLIAVPVSGAPEKAKAGDERLEKAITVRAADKPLQTLLEQISRDTGVTLRTAPNYEDRPITMRVKEMPLRAFMDAVAFLYRDTWAARGQGKETVYVLEASAARRNRQRQLLEAQKRTQQTELMNYLRKVAADGPASWELEQFGPNSDHQRYAESLKARANMLTQLPPETIAHLFDGERMRINLADAPGRFGEALWNYVEKFEMARWPSQARANAWIEFSAEPYAVQWPGLKGVPLQGLVIGFGGSGGIRSASYSVVVHPSTLAAKFEQEFARLRRGEEQEPDERRRQGGKILERILPSQKEFQAGARLARAEQLVALADAADLNLISDAHTKITPPHLMQSVPALAGNTVEVALNAVCDFHACYWRVFAPSTILVRSRYWWMDDLAEPPATGVVRWQSLLEDTGVLPLEETLKIATLLPEQQARLRMKVPETSRAFKAWLRFYAGLNKGQKKAASKAGIPLWKIPESQRHVLVHEGSNGPLGGNPDGERTIYEAAAMLKVADETNTKVLEGMSEKTFPRVLTFSVEPVPDATGRTRLRSLRQQVVLPFRERPAISPGRKSETGNSAASPSSRP